MSTTNKLHLRRSTHTHPIGSFNINDREILGSKEFMMNIYSEFLLYRCTDLLVQVESVCSIHLSIKDDELQVHVSLAGHKLYVDGIEYNAAQYAKVLSKSFNELERTRKHGLLTYLNLDEHKKFTCIEAFTETEGHLFMMVNGNASYYLGEFYV